MYIHLLYVCMTSIHVYTCIYTADFHCHCWFVVSVKFSMLPEITHVYCRGNNCLHLCVGINCTCKWSPVIASASVMGRVMCTSVLRGVMYTSVIGRVQTVIFKECRSNSEGMWKCYWYTLPCGEVDNWAVGVVSVCLYRNLSLQTPLQSIQVYNYTFQKPLIVHLPCLYRKL